MKLSEKSIIQAKFKFGEKTAREAAQCVEEWFESFFDEVFSDPYEDERDFILAVIFLSVMNDIFDDHFPIYNQYYKANI